MTLVGLIDADKPQAKSQELRAKSQLLFASC